MSRQRQAKACNREPGRKSRQKTVGGKKSGGEGEQQREEEPGRKEKQKPPDSLGDLKSSRLGSLSYER